MAVDMFLKLEGIDGESLDASHTSEIDVLAWSWGMAQSGSMHIGGGGGSGKVSVQDFSATKYIDKSTPNLLKYCCNGKHIPEATLTVRKAGGSPIEYVVLKMKKVIISSISTGGSGGEDLLTENITLNFENFEYIYKPQSASGDEEGAVTAKWDMAKNAES